MPPVVRGTSLDLKHELSSGKMRPTVAAEVSEVSNSLHGAVVDPAQIARNEALTKLANKASWAGNIVLLAVKIVAYGISGSKSVAAAVVDSAVDLISQGILSVADTYIHRGNPNYPAGRSRLTCLAVLACATLMICASIEVFLSPHPNIRHPVPHPHPNRRPRDTVDRSHIRRCAAGSSPRSNTT
jgi:hypothetical protein